jgi:ABC-type proline/glycine betaine transport system substrate-binding protein
MSGKIPREFVQAVEEMLTAQEAYFQQAALFKGEEKDPLRSKLLILAKERETSIDNWIALIRDEQPAKYGTDQKFDVEVVEGWEDDFIALVETLRNFQRCYFKRQESKLLRECQKLELKARNWIAQHKVDVLKWEAFTGSAFR